MVVGEEVGLDPVPFDHPFQQLHGPLPLETLVAGLPNQRATHRQKNKTQKKRHGEDGKREDSCTSHTHYILPIRTVHFLYVCMYKHAYLYRIDPGGGGGGGGKMKKKMAKKVDNKLFSRKGWSLRLLKTCYSGV